MVSISWISKAGLEEHWRTYLEGRPSPVISSWSLARDKALRANSESWLGAQEIPVEVASDFLHWAFTSNRIQSDEYFRAICVESSTPRLRPEYFEAPPDQMFWSSVKDEGPWTRAFFPLVAWDDILIIGTCLAEINLNFSRKVRLVLCEPDALHRYAENFLPTSPQPASSATAEPFALLSSESSETPFDPSSILSHEESESDQSEEPRSSTQDSTEEAPQGLILNFSNTEQYSSPISLQHDDPQLPTLPLQHDQPEFPAIPLQPGEPQLPTLPQQHDGLQFPAPPLQHDDPQVVSNTHPQVGSNIQPQVVSHSQPPHIQQKPQQDTGPNTQPVPTSETTSSFKLSQEQLAKLFSVPLNQLDPVHLDECRNLDALGAQALLQTSITFEGTMLLLMKPSDTGIERLMPWKWNDLLLSIKRNQPDAIDLSIPSLFSIVQKTNKPFHGPVTDSAVSQKFFNDFFRGHKPAHITLVPLISEQRLIGMLLGSTDGRIENRQSLRLMERLAAHFSRRYQHIRSTGNGRPFPISAA